MRHRSPEETGLKHSAQFGGSVRERTPGDAKHQPKRWLLPLVLLACGIFLYLQVFVLPATPRLASGDQAIYLHHATRMLDGQIIYRDYDHFTPPGTDVLYAALFKLFGVKAWIPQAMLILIGLVAVWLSIRIARALLAGGLPGKQILLPGFLFLALPFSGYLDATHHWYSALAGTAALAVAIERRTTARMAWAGTLWGLATCFSQSMMLGALGFSVFLLWERRHTGESWSLLLEKEAGLLGSFVATVVAFNCYFLWKVGVRRFLYYTVIFVAKYYSADRFNTWRVYLREWPSIHSWPNWADLAAWPFVHILLPWLYVVFFLHYWLAARSRPKLPWDRLMLVNLTGLALFLAVASAPAYNRLYTVSLPGIILLVWLTNSSVWAGKVISPILWTAVIVLGVAKPIVTQTRWKAFLDLPSGRTAFFQPAVYEKTKWVAERTQPSEYFFGDPLLCFELWLRNPTRVPFLRPTDYTRPEEVRNVVESLENHQVRFVSWYRGLDIPNGEGNHLAPINLYLHSHYHVVETFANGDKIWERNHE